MNQHVSEKIQQHHKIKSNVVKKLKRKLKYKAKHSVPIAHLEKMLLQEKNYTIDPRDYSDWHNIDDVAYSKAVAAQEARIELLKLLINPKGNQH